MDDEDKYPDHEECQWHDSNFISEHAGFDVEMRFTKPHGYLDQKVTYRKKEKGDLMKELIKSSKLIEHLDTPKIRWFHLEREKKCET